MPTRPSSDRTHARRDVLRGAAAAAAGSLLFDHLAKADDATPNGVTRQALQPPGAPAADIGYSPALLAQGKKLLFISGQGSKDHHADMETQIRQTLDRIGILLKAAGASFANVVMMRSYWLHLQRDLPLFRKVRRDYLVKPYPAATAVGVNELASPDAQLEIEVVAVV
ncbi:MAG TPA: Rid family hydrolase [Lacipirellulaceae bacterium]|nr:Rid family hydrolase [Lacipirellulaceae bacterium]